MTRMDYRQRIYKRYATRFQYAQPKFDEGAANKWGQAYVRYLRGWFPQDTEVPILEVACGGGRFLHFLRMRGYTHVQGVDISPEQVALSRQVLPNEFVHEGNAIAFLEAHPGAFSLIVGLDVVEHFTKDECLRFLDTCHAALKSGGRLILQTPNLDSPFAIGVRYGDFTHEIGLSSNSAVWLLHLAGFEDVEVRETGPMIHGLVSAVRWLLWRVIRWQLAFWNLVETGTQGAGVYTRVMLVSAVRPEGQGHD